MPGKEIFENFWNSQVKSKFLSKFPLLQNVCLELYHYEYGLFVLNGGFLNLNYAAIREILLYEFIRAWTFLNSLIIWKWTWKKFLA